MNAPARNSRAQALRRQNEPKRAKCPICGKAASDAYRPFCGKRCADVDLNRWLKGRYALPGEPAGEAEETGTE